MKNNLIIKLFTLPSIQLLQKLRAAVDEKENKELDVIYDDCRSIVISALIAKNGLDQHFVEFDLADHSEKLLNNLYEISRFYADVMGSETPEFFSFREERFNKPKFSA